MSLLREMPERLVFYATPGHECSYLPGREAVTVFADPAYPKDNELYTVLSRHGFRRSGEHIYTPRCPACQACVPVRVPVREFRPRRRQRRVMRVNADLAVRALPAEFRDEHFALYRAYLANRHPGGGMDQPTPEQYLNFLTSGWSETIFYEFSLARRVVAVAVVDRLRDGLSAVYTFFAPQESARAPGVNAILFEIGEAAREGLDWLYLGYWVDGCRKMHYKRDYLPQERLLDGRWCRTEG